MKATAMRSLFVIAGLGGSRNPKISGKPGIMLNKISGESGNGFLVVDR